MEWAPVLYAAQCSAASWEGRQGWILPAIHVLPLCSLFDLEFWLAVTESAWDLTIHESESLRSVNPLGSGGALWHVGLG